jgi:hypothetical protein
LAENHGGSLTINPETGLPEAGFLDKLLPTIIGAGISFFSGGTIDPMTAAAMVGGVETARTGDIGRGISAGLGAYGGASLTSGISGAGSSAMANEAGTLAGNEATAWGTSQLTDAGANVYSQTQLDALKRAAIDEGVMQQGMSELTGKTTAGELLSKGWEGVKANPMQAVKDYARPLMMAAGPAILAGASAQSGMPQTTTKPGMIRPSVYNPYTGGFVNANPYEAQVKGAAGGGLMGMADGGYNPGQLDFAQRSEPVIRMANGGVPGYAGNEGSVVGGDAAFEAYQAGEYEKARALLGEAGMGAQDVVSKYGLSQADAATVAKNLGYAGDMSGIQYASATPPAAAAPVMMQDNTVQNAMANTVANAGADTTQQKQEWTGGQPSFAEWMSKIVSEEDRGKAIPDLYTAANLYSVVGSTLDPYRQTDTRDWASVMNAKSPNDAINALIQQNLQFYGGPGRAEVDSKGRGQLFSGSGIGLTSDITRADEFGIMLRPELYKAQLDAIDTTTPSGRTRYDRINALYQKAQLDAIDTTTPSGRAEYERTNARYQQALTDQSKTTGLAALASSAGITDVTKTAGATGANAAASTPSYTKYSDAQVAKWFTDNPTATNAQVQTAIRDSKIDPAAVNRYIASIADPFRGSTDTTGGSGVLGIYNQMKAQGIDPTELYKAEIANDPKYAGYTQPMIQKAYDLSKGAYALTDQIAKDKIAADPKFGYDKQWVKFMDTNKYTVDDMAQAFGLSKKEVRDRYDAVKKAEVKTIGVGGTGGTGGTGTNTNITCPDGYELNAAGTACVPVKVVAGPIDTVPGTSLPPGVGGGGKTVVNENGTITTTPNIPGRPKDGFTGMADVRDAYTKGGGSLGYIPYAPKTTAEFEEKYGYKTPSGSKAAYDYLMGKTDYSAVPYTKTGEVMKPYAESVLGMTLPSSSKQYLFDPATKTYKINPDYVIPTYNAEGVKTTELTNKDVVDYWKSEPSSSDFYAWMTKNNLSLEQIAAATQLSISEISKKIKEAKKTADDEKASKSTEDTSYEIAKAGGLQRLAGGGITGDGNLNLHIPLDFGGGGGGGYTPMGGGFSSGGGGYSGDFSGQNNTAGDGFGGRPPPTFSSTNTDTTRVPGNDLVLPDNGLVVDYSPFSEEGRRKRAEQVELGRAGGVTATGPMPGAQYYADGGMTGYAAGGQFDLGGYSDGGRLLRGPGDGVSDSIPATIGNKRPARLADGEFVVPARIVSELGNGSTEAGARKLYAMMDRIQSARRSTVGKGKVAKNSRSDKYLPA